MSKIELFIGGFILLVDGIVQIITFKPSSIYIGYIEKCFDKRMKRKHK